MLALPAGLAAIGDTEDALVPAVAIMSVLGAFSAYSFYSIGRLCSLEKTKSLTESWEKVVGKDSAWLITTACFVTPLGAALSFSISLGSFFSSLARTAGLTVCQNICLSIYQFEYKTKSSIRLSQGYCN